MKCCSGLLCSVHFILIPAFPTTSQCAAHSITMETPVRSNIPSEFCKSSQEALREAGKSVLDDCPICAKRGTLCEVGCHPPTASSAVAPTSAPSASHPSGSRKRRWDQLNSILEEVAKKSKDSTAFSAVKWADVEDVLGYQNYKQGTKAVPADVLDLLFSQLLKIGVVFGSVSSGKEAQFISPVLYEVCALFEGRVKISVEEDLKGVNIHTNGHFEYVLEVDGRKVCIVEAKKTDMEKGMAQALLGDETIADLDNVSEVYAIVTNYREWYFLKNTDDAIFRDACTLDIEDDVPTKASVGKIAGKIYGLLSGV